MLSDLILVTQVGGISPNYDPEQTLIIFLFPHRYQAMELSPPL